MISVSDILKILEQIPVWKSVSGLPKRIAELEARVKALESAGGPRAGPAANDCPRCGARLTFVSEKPHDIFGDVGVLEHTLRCDGCGQTVKREWTGRSGYK